jgi:hypothetical protein
MRRCCRLLLFTLLALCLGTSSVLAQATSSLRGKVADAQGGALPGVTVVLKNVETAFSREVVTDETGSYSLPAGAARRLHDHRRAARVPDRQREDHAAGQHARTLDLKMEIGGITESVQVEAAVTMVNTTDATVGNAFKEVQVRQLPLMTRNVVELLSLQPGVTPTGETMGARRDQNNITLDGVDINDNQTSGLENPTQNSQQGG